MNDFEQLDALRQQRGDERMRSQTPGADATVPQHASIDTIRFLQARIRELRQENERLHKVVEAARPFTHPDWNVLSSLRQQHAAEMQARERLRQALDALDADA